VPYSGRRMLLVNHNIPGAKVHPANSITRCWGRAGSMKLAAHLVRIITRHFSDRLGAKMLSRLPERAKNFEATVRYEGVRLRVSTGEHRGRQLYYKGTYEPEQVRAFLSLIRPGSIVFDVGANEGIYSLIAAAKGAIVYAFEPSMRARSLLERNLELNKLASAVTVISCAVSDHEGRTVFYETSPTSTGVGRVFGFGANAGQHGTYPVTTNTLDHFALTLALPDVIKIDIEGAEYLALEQGTKLFSLPDGPALLIEFHPEEIRHLGGTVQKCLARLRSFGYFQYHVAGRPQVTNRRRNLWYLFSKKPLEKSKLQQVA
jgi:FkbM family methyltransferase